MMRRWNTFCLALLLLGFAGTSVASSSLLQEEAADFAEEIADELADFHRERESELHGFRDERDREFAAFLADQWNEFEVSPGLHRSPSPKPVTPPKARPAPVDEDLTPRGGIISPPVPAPTPAPPPKSVTEPGLSQVVVDFYGLELHLNYDPALRVVVAPPFDNRSISAFWRSAAAADVSPLLDRLGELRTALSLNDWAYYQLVAQVAMQIQEGEQAATLSSWLLLLKSGYRVKVGYRNDGFMLLLPSVTPIYQVPFYTVDSTRFYHFPNDATDSVPGAVHTYRDDYSGADHVMALGEAIPPATGGEVLCRSLFFSYGGERHAVEVRCRRGALDFYGSYPQTEFSVFFAGKVTAEAEASLLEALAPLIAGKTETEAVNILLRFVQTAFPYRTDKEQFGRERYLFAEETLAFEASDCEDRAVLFSYLVRRLTGLEVVGLHFPGHVATAVRFSVEVPGASVEVDGQRYVICDPTYINADIGMAMPQFSAGQAKIIRFGS